MAVWTNHTGCLRCIPALWSKNDTEIVGIRQTSIESIRTNLDAVAKEIDSDTKHIASMVVDGYASTDGGRLIGMTHEKGTPWLQTRKRFRNVVIPTKTIEAYYKDMKADTIGR